MSWYANQKRRNEEAKAYKADHGISPATAEFQAKMAETKTDYAAKRSAAKETKRARKAAKKAARST